MEHRESAAKLFWQILNQPDFCAAQEEEAGASGSRLSSSPKVKRPKYPNIQNARVAVKLFLTVGLTVDEVGGLERLRTQFMAPMLRLSERNGQVWDLAIPDGVACSRFMYLCDKFACQM
jgi:hypothetical protein